MGRYRGRKKKLPKPKTRLEIRVTQKTLEIFYSIFNGEKENTPEITMDDFILELLRNKYGKKF